MKPDHYSEETCCECQHWDDGYCARYDFEASGFGRCQKHEPLTADIAGLEGANISWKHV